MSIMICSVNGNILLQWGRDLKIAEIEEDFEGLGFTAEASMGPRSEDRGNYGEALRAFVRAQ